MCLRTFAVSGVAFLLSVPDTAARQVRIKAKASGLVQDVAKAEQRAKFQTLTAPVDGVVQQRAVHTVGGVVTPAQAFWIATSLTSKSSPTKSRHGTTSATSTTPKPTGDSQPPTPASS
jgi:hypothetical protein